MRSSPKPPRAPRRGATLVYVTVTITALIGVCSLAVDWGRLQLAKTELERAADAASRAGAASVLTDTTQARANASSYAALNTVDGTPLALQSSDILIGKWNSTTGTLDTTSPTPDTVQVTASRTKARGNPIPLTIRQILGGSSADLTFTSATQATSSTPQYGIVGLSGVTTSGSPVVGTYNANTAGYASGSGVTQASIASNGTMTLSSTMSVGGTIYYYTGSAPAGAMNYAAKTKMTSAVPTPATPAAGSYLTTNDNASVGLSTSGATFSMASGSKTWPGGNYVLNSFSMSGGTLTFTGPATVWMYGSVGISGGTITTYQGKPINLKLNLCSSSSISISGGSNLLADVDAPTSSLVMSGGGVAGSVICSSIIMSGGALYYDTTLGPNGGSGTTTVSTIK